MRQALHPDLRIRSSVEPPSLADRLEGYLDQLKPGTAVQHLVNAGKPNEAFSLLHDILLEQVSSELLLLSAEIADTHLGRPLEAIDTLEQAIRSEPGNPAAYAAQLKVIMAHLNQMWPMMGDQLDGSLWRDFQSLPPEQQQRCELDMAHYLLDRRRYLEAAQFIYPRLFDDDKYAWWKFGITLAYASVLMETGRLNEAGQQVQDIKAKLQRVRQNLSLSPQEIHFFGIQVAELEVKLLKRNSQR